MTLQIHNIRLGHACNSSSTHSIVPLSVLGGHATDDMLGAEPGEYWGQRFVLASTGAKMQYLAALLVPYEPTPKDIGRVVALTGAEPLADPPDESPFGDIDHQSVFAFPKGRHSDLYLDDVIAYFKREDVVIVGGADSDPIGEISHLPLYGGGLSSARIRPGTAPDGSRYWTIMNRERGDKVRFSFLEQPLRGNCWDEDYYPEVKPVFTVPYGDKPDLVDLKVTGFCPFEQDCPWCYQASDRAGRHADAEVAFAWLDAFAAAEVFEIALGGGEPTLWPHLDEFVRRAAEREINVNLTTKNFTWLANGGHDGVKAVAVSINNARDLARFKALDPDRKHRWLTVQCIPGFCDDELLAETIAVAEAQHRRITFLGVKKTGRAVGEQRSDDLRWLELLRPYAEQEYGYWVRDNIAIDTLMAQTAEAKLQELGVNPVYYETAEGRFSCYVDATTGMIAPSSYAPAEQYIARTPDKFLSGFRAVQRAARLR